MAEVLEATITHHRSPITIHCSPFTNHNLYLCIRNRAMKRLLTIILLTLLGGCLDKYPHAPISPYEDRAFLYIRNLVNPATGLVSSRTNECFTTVYKNALAAMVFIHQGDQAAAEAIFDRFNAHAMVFIEGGNPLPFPGFSKDWDSCTGEPTGNNYWEGDNAFLLLALNYYSASTNKSTRYSELSGALVNWLVSRSLGCDTIVTEGVANMYAALLPHNADHSVVQALSRLQACYLSSVSYPTVLDHTVRGALIFNTLDGFNYLDNFSRNKVWVHDNSFIKAYSAFSGDSYINVEISAQLLLAAILTQRTSQVPTLQTELERMWLPGSSTKEAGLPYFTENIGFDNSATEAIIDPTAYMLFSYWRFNPFTGK